MVPITLGRAERAGFAEGDLEGDDDGLEDGEEVPAEWVLPQSPVTQEELPAFLEANSEMPDLHYAKFGGEDLPGFPEAWQDR